MSIYLEKSKTMSSVDKRLVVNQRQKLFYQICTTFNGLLFLLT